MNFNSKTFYEENINIEKLRNFIEENNLKSNKLLQAINDLESSHKSFKQNHDLEEWKYEVSKLNQIIETENYNEISCQIYKISNMNVTRDILDEMDIIDKEKEEILDMLHDEVYSYDPEYVEIKLAKRISEDEVISKESVFKKSTCPDWLINIVK